MNLELFIAKRISLQSERTFSKLIVRIAIIGIMLGLCVMILSMAITRGFKEEIRQKVRGFAGDIQLLKYDLNSSYENSVFKINEKQLQKIKNTEGVLEMMPFATKPGIINANKEVEGVILKGVDKQYSWTNFSKTLKSGRVLNFKDTVKVKQEVIISNLIAKRLKLKVGDDFLMYFVQENLRKRKFTIVGIFETDVEEVDKTYVIGDISLIRRLNNWQPDDVGGVEIKVNNFVKVDETAEQISMLLPPQIKTATVKELYPTIFEWLALLDVNTTVILVLMLVVAVINMISALLIMILERTSMIGLLKAMGAENWGIRKIFLYNALYLIAIGMLAGNFLSIGFAIFQQQTHLLSLDPQSYYMNFVPIKLYWLDIVLINAGTLLVCLLVLLIPSTLVSRISPIKAIVFK